MITLVNALGPVIITGLFSVILWKLQAADADRKENRKQTDERMRRIEANTAKLADHDRELFTLSKIAEELKQSSDTNRDGFKIIMRYMLQRYHAEYMLQGFITSHQKTEFLEAFEVYSTEGGNGTAHGWRDEVCALPVRDDLNPCNPYLELLKNKGEN